MKKIKTLIRNIKKYWLLVLSGLLCLIALMFFLLTERNVRILNDMNPSFYYKERSTVSIHLPSDEFADLNFRNDHVKIKNSYEFESVAECYAIVLAVKAYATRDEIEMTRSNTEMVGELRLHNFLYRIGYKPDETGDADLEYIQDRRWYVNVASELVGWMGL